MEIIKLAWVGTRTENADPTVAFFRDVLGLRLELDEPGFWMMKLPDGSKVEVFGPDSDINRHFTSSGQDPGDPPPGPAGERRAVRDACERVLGQPDPSALRARADLRHELLGPSRPHRPGAQAPGLPALA